MSENVDYVVVSVRLPKTLYDQVKERSERDHRSISKQVIHFIEQALQADA